MESLKKGDKIQHIITNHMHYVLELNIENGYIKLLDSIDNKSVGFISFDTFYKWYKKSLSTVLKKL